MKILTMTLGTRGDVQPFLALVLGLRAASHDAVLVAPHRYADFATRFAVPFAGVDDGPLRLLDGAPIDGGLRARIAQARSMPGTFAPVLADCWAVARHSQAQMIVHNGQILAARTSPRPSASQQSWPCRCRCTYPPAPSPGPASSCRRGFRAG
jgi:sterol 3beta-glucosyltransferase